MISDKDCVFCKIIKGELPCQLIREWSDAIAIVPLNPVVPGGMLGHLLVIPKNHVRDVTEDPATSAEVFRRASELAATPCNLITSAGVEATQTVFHLHVHIVPRSKDDGLCLPWTNQVKENTHD